MNNYDYCAAWAAKRGGRVLDYGCGHGALVTKLRAAGVEAYGCDVFYEGGNFNSIPDSPHIARMDGDRIPFPDGYFDAVVSNQVLEHVPDLGVVALEIARVLKPDGAALHLFPHRGVLVEPHIRVPLIHRFRKGQHWRLYWVAAMRALRYWHAAWPLMEVSAKRLAWIDAWTHYRSANEITRCFKSHFRSVERIEDQLLDSRRKLPLPRIAKQMIWRKLAGTALLVHR